MTTFQASPVMMIEMRSDLVVTGYNPEDADMDRPNGEQYGESYYFVAGDADGNRKCWGAFATVALAEMGFEYDAPPVMDWRDSQPAYGSLAFEMNDGEAGLMDYEELENARR